MNGLLAWRPSSDLAPEAQIALDLARRALLVAPAIVGAAGLLRGLDGAASAAFALLVVVANLGIAALLAVTFARMSFGALGAATLAGYPIRLGLVVLSVVLVRNTGWFDAWALGLTLGFSHLGLLIWEARKVSLSFTYPALAPQGEPVGVPAK